VKIMQFLKRNFWFIFDLIVRIWFLISIIVVSPYLCEYLKIPIFFSLGISFGIGWFWLHIIFPKKKETNVYISKEFIDELRKH